MAYDGVFAAGDVINMIDPLTNTDARTVKLRTAQLAGGQAAVCAKNVEMYVSGKPKRQFKKYPNYAFGPTELTLANVSLGLTDDSAPTLSSFFCCDKYCYCWYAIIPQDLRWRYSPSTAL